MGNKVSIYVQGAKGYGEEGVVAIDGSWIITPGQIVMAKSGDSDNVELLDPKKGPTLSTSDNEIRLEVDVDRDGSAAVSSAYLNAGHNRANETDASVDVNTPDADKQSAGMCVDGTLDLPAKMNFYFPLSITTPEHLQMTLLLGQSHVKQGWIHKAKALYDNGKAAASKASAATEKNDWVEALNQVWQFTKSLVDVFADKNLWNVTVIGTKDYPAAVLLPKDSKEKKDTQILCMGPATVGHDKGVQKAFFTVIGGDDKFGLTVFPAVIPKE